MLGMSARPAAWQWQAMGKHPAAADYIQLLAGTPLTKALGDWMTKGYDQWQAGRLGAHDPCSWRFWLRGGQKEHLVCGVLRDSSDRIGRPFPLMLAGEGTIKGWELRWPWLPRLLDKTWARMERLAVHGHEDLKGFSEELMQLTAPSAQQGPPIAEEIAPPSADATWQACQADLRQSGRAVMPLEATPGVDPAHFALNRHAGLQSCCRDIPRAVFMGGNPQRTWLAVILQPLSAADFVALWSLA